MALPVVYANRRATIARLDTVAGASGLNLGEAFLVTDQQRLAVATGPDDYALMARLDEVGGGGGSVSVVSARIRRSTDQVIPVGTGWTDIVWNAAGHQTGATMWTSGATITIPEDGVYQIAVELTYSQTGVIGTVVAMMQCLVNGAVIGDMEQQVILAAKPALFTYAERPFLAGDTVVVQTKHDNSSALTMLSQGNHSPDIIVSKVGGAKGDAGPSGVYVQQTRPVEIGPWQWWVKDAGGRVVNLILNDGIA